MDSTAPHRRGWLAALLALPCNGLGHVYAGRVGVGLAIQAIWTAGSVGFALAARTNFRAAAATAVPLFLFWIAQAMDAARTARRAPPPTHGPAARALGLLAFFIAASAVSATLGPAVKRRVVETFYVSSVSMTPTAAQGDVIVMARGGVIERGAVVMHAAPAGSRSLAPLLRRIVALGGDTVEVRDGNLILNGVAASLERKEGDCAYDSRRDGGPWKREACVEFVEGPTDRAYRTHCTPFLACGDVAPARVPQGHVFVLGDHRDHSADSRVYGPIPESAVLGRVGYIYFSVGPSGIRWNRIGMPIR